MTVASTSVSSWVFGCVQSVLVLCNAFVCFTFCRQVLFSAAESHWSERPASPRRRTLSSVSPRKVQQKFQELFVEKTHQSVVQFTGLLALCSAFLLCTLTTEVQWHLIFANEKRKEQRPEFITPIAIAVTIALVILSTYILFIARLVLTFTSRRSSNAAKKRLLLRAVYKVTVWIVFEFTAAIFGRVLYSPKLLKNSVKWRALAVPICVVFVVLSHLGISARILQLFVAQMRTVNERSPESRIRSESLPQPRSSELEPEQVILPEVVAGLRLFSLPSDSHFGTEGNGDAIEMMAKVSEEEDFEEEEEEDDDDDYGENEEEYEECESNCSDCMKIEDLEVCKKPRTVKSDSEMLRVCITEVSEGKAPSAEQPTYATPQTRCSHTASLRLDSMTKTSTGFTTPRISDTATTATAFVASASSTPSATQTPSTRNLTPIRSHDDLLSTTVSTAASRRRAISVPPVLSLSLFRRSKSKEEHSASVTHSVVRRSAEDITLDNQSTVLLTVKVVCIQSAIAVCPVIIGLITALLVVFNGHFPFTSVTEILALGTSFFGAMNCLLLALSFARVRLPLPWKKAAKKWTHAWARWYLERIIAKAPE